MVRRNMVLIGLAACAVLAASWTIGNSEPKVEQEIMRMAQASCPDQCRASYGQCMKSSANRPACQAQLDACLKSCSAAKVAK